LSNASAAYSIRRIFARPSSLPCEQGTVRGAVLTVTTVSLPDLDVVWSICNRSTKPAKLLAADGVWPYGARRQVQKIILICVGVSIPIDPLATVSTASDVTARGGRPGRPVLLASLWPRLPGVPQDTHPFCLPDRTNTVGLLAQLRATWSSRKSLRPASYEEYAPIGICVSLSRKVRGPCPSLIRCRRAFVVRGHRTGFPI
jgi:hypothetical protein